MDNTSHNQRSQQWSVPDSHFHHREPGNDALLSAMTKAGCFHVQIGFQTVNPGSLRSAGTAQNRTGEYCKVVRAPHRHKILVLGFFMFRFDADKANISREAEEAIRKIDLDDACLCILTPYPGIEKYEQFKREGRLMSKARPGYGWSNAVFQPANISPVELEQGVQGVYERLHGHFRPAAWLRILRRLPILIKQPHVLVLMVKALFRRIDISRKPG